MHGQNHIKIITHRFEISTEQTNRSSCFIQFKKAYYRVIQPYFESNVLFVNKAFLSTHLPPPKAFRYMYTHARPTSEYLTNYVPFCGLKLASPAVRVHEHAFRATTSNTMPTRRGTAPLQSHREESHSSYMPSG